MNGRQIKLDHVSGIVVALLGAGVMWVASDLPFTDPAVTLGSGAFPFILGLLLVVLGVAIFGSAAFAAGPDQELAPLFGWRVTKRPAIAFAMLAASVALFATAGFALGISLLLIGFLRVFSPYSWPVVMTIAAAATAGFYGLFGVALDVPIELFPAF